MFKRTMLSIILIVCCMTLAAAQQEDSSAQLRAANYVVDAPDATFTVDGEPLSDEALPFTAAAPHAEVSAGTHEIAFVSEGETIASANVELETEQSYTAALIGQIADDSVQIILIPETELVAELRDLQNPASYAVLLHGISDAPGVDFTLDGDVLREDLTFGEYDVFSISQAPHDILVTFSDDPDTVLFQNEGETPPANDLLLLTVMAGAYPDKLDVTGAVSRLPDRSVIDFLSTAQDAEGNRFDTLLRALEVTGLSESLATEGAFTLFAPTDAAFAALPQETQDLLFAYPDALRAILLGHVVDDVFVLRDLADDLTVTTRQGTAITLSAEGDTIQVNQNAALLFGGFPVVTNGNVIGINQILIPTVEN